MARRDSTTRWTDRGTTSAVALRPMVAFARTRGIDVNAILAGVGLSPSALDDYDRRIPESTRSLVWAAAVEQAADASFGLRFAESAQIGAYDVLDYSLLFSGTLDDALGRVLRFHRVLCDAWAFRRVVDGGVVRWRRVDKTPPQEAEAVLAVLVLRARALTGNDIVPSEISFAHPAPVDTTPHAALFRCPVRFGAVTSELVFHKTDLALAVKTANPGVNRVLDRYMTEVLERLPRSSSFIDRVRATVGQTLLRGRPTLRSVARDLRTSPRTVQRRLREHGTGLAEVVDSVRRELGEPLLAEGRMSITEIAFQLGFDDVSGFRRARKRWASAPASLAHSDAG